MKTIIHYLKGLTMLHVFEIIDSTDDEMYFPLGIFLTEGEALRAIRKADPEHPVSEHAEDYESLSIVRRKIGWDGFGKRIWEFRRETQYNEERDEYLWKVIGESKF